MCLRTLKIKEELHVLHRTWLGVIDINLVNLGRVLWSTQRSPAIFRVFKHSNFKKLLGVTLPQKKIKKEQKNNIEIKFQNQNQKIKLK